MYVSINILSNTSKANIYLVEFKKIYLYIGIIIFIETKLYLFHNDW